MTASKPILITDLYYRKGLSTNIGLRRIGLGCGLALMQLGSVHEFSKL